MTLAVVKPGVVDVEGAPWITGPQGQRISSHDTAARTKSILDGFKRSRRCSFHQAPDLKAEDVASVLYACHDRDYLEYLEECGRQLKAGEPLLDDRYCRPDSRPHMPVFAGVFDVARAGVLTSLGAAQMLLAGETTVYAACRPPGHHAGPNWSGGYCYLNNAMAAARYLVNAGVGPIAVIDLDFHFGDGSSAIAKQWSDVFFCSLHGSASAEYPWMKTEPNEPEQMLESFPTSPSKEELHEAIGRIQDYCADRCIRGLVISLGYDLISGDPHGRWSFSPEIFTELGSRLAGMNLPLCIVQEGGYSVDSLGDCAMHLAQGVTEGS